jgi:polyketide synthase 7
MWAELGALFARGALSPLPVTTWDLRCAPGAFRYVSQARHTGKVVFTLPPPELAEGTVLVTGGTGTVGGLVAGHLVRAHQAGKVILASRRGPGAAGAAGLAARLAGLGAQVRVAACDLAVRHQVAGLLAGTGPLAGVVHCAGVTEDATVGSLDAGGIARVLAPKAAGAWHLHELAGEVPLFVLFSSAAGILGAPGQGNYAAANSFLDALASWRRARGLSGQSLAWGLWQDPSELTRHLTATDMGRIRRAGLIAMPAEQALALLDAALHTAAPALVTASLDAAALARHAHAVGSPPAAAAGAGLVAQVAGLDPAARQQALTRLVCAQAARVLGHVTASTIEPGRAFRDLGFDSLTALELRNRLTAATSLSLPTTLIFDHPTPAETAAYIGGKITPKAAGSFSALLAEVERLTAILPGANASSRDREEISSHLLEFLRVLSNRDDEPFEDEDSTCDLDSDEKLFAVLEEESRAVRD